MLTQAPLPSWANLFRALLCPPLPGAELATHWRRDGEVAGWLSRSAWSLALIALWRRQLGADPHVTVWLPDYFCNSSLRILRTTGVRFVFYPLNADMAPDMEACQKLSEVVPVGLFVLVHYFGRPTEHSSARDFCGHHGAWLIEDAVHVLRPASGVGDCGDFVLYSPHKHLPIPDGALLVARSEGPARLGQVAITQFGPPDFWPDQLSELQRQMGGAVDNSPVQPLVWLSKRILQKLGVRGLRSSATPFAESVRGQIAFARLPRPRQSRLAQRMLAVVLPELGTVARWRQRHQMLWDALLVSQAADQSATVLAGERSVGRGWTPYLGVYCVDSATAQAAYNYWQRRGLPVTTWPDLPPEVMTRQECHAGAIRLRHTRLYLPLHQSLSAREIFEIGRMAGTVPEEKPSLCIAWDEVSPAKWQRWMEKAGRTNLLQSQSYGTAKTTDSGWRIKRGTFYRGDAPIAFVQVLQKRFAGVLLISRINRGPVFLGSPNYQEKRETIASLAGLGCLWRGNVLSIAPELELTGANLALMESLFFKQFSPTAWQSIWLDLRMDATTLRRKINGKCRNMLSFAERSGLRVEIETDDLSFDWMMERYQALMSEKAFSGAPIRLLRALRAHLPAESRPIIMRAIHDGEAVAGICLARHGVAATYLLGWNGKAGRKVKANHYLLWQAAVYLKEAGLEWFDLGGVSEELTPGISTFKSGFGGEQYELVGEFWRW